MDALKHEVWRQFSRLMCEQIDKEIMDEQDINRAIEDWEKEAGRRISEEIDRAILLDITEKLGSSTSPEDEEEGLFRDAWVRSSEIIDHLRHGNLEQVPDEIMEGVYSDPTHVWLDDEDTQLYHGINGGSGDEDLIPIPWPEHWPERVDAEWLKRKGIEIL